MTSGSTAQKIVLIGSMGAGKTVVGRALADLLSFSHCDTDELVESTAGMRIRDIFQHSGEADFRLREQKALSSALKQAPVVISTGGGAVITPANRAVLSSEAWVVYLSVPPLVAKERCEEAGLIRPLLERFSHLSDWETLMQEREPHYRSLADYTVDASVDTPTQLAQVIENAWKAA